MCIFFSQNLDTLCHHLQSVIQNQSRTVMGMGGCLSPGLGSSQLTGGPENSVIITRFFQGQSKPARLLDSQRTQDSKSIHYAGQVSH